MTSPSDISSRALYLELTQLWGCSQFLAPLFVPTQCHLLKVSVTSLDTPRDSAGQGGGLWASAAPQEHQILVACCDGIPISPYLLRALTPVAMG